jgi:putative phage-type endonuclease
VNTVGQATVIAPATGPEWHEARQRGIGGTDISAIAGINPWKSALAVYYEKVEGRDDTKVTERMEWGHILEPVIAEQTAERHALTLDEVPYIIAHPEYPWALASIDRLIINPERGNGVLEVKNMGHWSASQVRINEGEDAIPDHYLLQVQWYLFVTGLKWGMFAALMEGSELRIVEVKRDDALIADLFRIAQDFWQCVENRTPPAADASDSTAETLKRMFPEAEQGKVANLTPEYEGLLHERARLKHEIKTRESELKGIENKIKLAIGDAELATCGTFELTLKTTRTMRFDSKRFQSERPEDYDAYKSESTYRTLRVKGE